MDARRTLLPKVTLGVGPLGRGAAATLAIMVVIQACAPGSAPTTSLRRLPFASDDGKFSIGAETVTEAAGARTVLGVRVLVVSRSPERVVFRRNQITLELADGGSLSPVEPSSIVDRPNSSLGGVGGAADICVALPLCAVAIALVLVSAASAAAKPAAEANYRARVQEYEAKSFPQTAVVTDGEVVGGFVFFVLPGSFPARTFDQCPQAWDYQLPPPSQRATVANMAGASRPRPMVLHVDGELDSDDSIKTSPERGASSSSNTLLETIRLRLVLGP
jgi:hypothetical protein